MNDEIPNIGTGERGVLLVSKPVKTESLKINREVLEKGGTRGKFVYDKEQGKLVEATERKRLELHYVIPDEMPPTEYMGSPDREFYTSKKALERRTRADGYVITGGERRRVPVRHKADRDQIHLHKQIAINDAKYGNVEMTEEQKERCRKEERIYQEYRRRRKLQGY